MEYEDEHPNQVPITSCHIDRFNIGHHCRIGKRREARTIDCKIRGSVAGPVRDGKQLIVFEAAFRNVSQAEYVSRINLVEVSVHDYFNGREEVYTRKVDMDWNFSPVLEPWQQKCLKIQFWRKVQPYSTVPRKACEPTLRL